MVALPDFLANPASDGDTIFQSDALDRNERDDIGRTQPRVRAGMFRQINEFGGLTHAANGRLGDVDRIAHQRDDAAVMVGIHLTIKEIDAIHLHGFQNCVNFGFVAAFRKVRNTFDEYWHKQ